MGKYQAYQPTVLANGERKVLYFHADWCPSCQKSEALLKDWYGAGKGLSVPVYKANYDTETELKARYGVTYQNTFVVLDGTGKALKTVQSPTEANLKGLLSK
jgi:thioredoxin 1